MRRRDLFKAVPAVALSAVALAARAAAPRAKITDIRVAKVKVVRQVGIYQNTFQKNSRPNPVVIGGGAFIEVVCDQGVIGIGPGVPPAMLGRLKDYLVGKDPFDVNDHARWLLLQGRAGVAVEIALWDIVGKLAGLPLYKLWGGGATNRVKPYGALLGIGEGPEERSRAALQVKRDGFSAVKLRLSYPSMKDDIRVVELTRKLVGDDYPILVDGNKAGPYAGNQMLTLWDHARARHTAEALQDLGVYWLEEPLARYDFDGLADLNKAMTMPIAGAEEAERLEDFRMYLERGCYDVLNPNPAVIGPTMYRQVQALALAFEARCVPHWGFVMGAVVTMHLVASRPRTPYGDMDEGPEMEVEHNPPLQDVRETLSIFDHDFKLAADGTMLVPEGPGLGVSIRPELIDRMG